MVPCGTPEVTGNQSKWMPGITTLCFLFARKFLNHTPYSKMAADLCAYKLALVASFKIKYSFEF